MCSFEIGDVAGKGLPAAMLVSVLVGAVRGVEEYTTNPAELLANLNERLVGRHAAFSTALIPAISAEGHVSIANAGHPAPYVDGVELGTTGSAASGGAERRRLFGYRVPAPSGQQAYVYHGWRGGGAGPERGTLWLRPLPRFSARGGRRDRRCGPAVRPGG